MSFRGKALEDIRAIAEWYDRIDPDATTRIKADLQRSLQLLLDYPHAGVPVTNGKIRRMVTRRYHFKIAYVVRGEHIEVLGVYRFQDRQS